MSGEPIAFWTLLTLFWGHGWLGSRNHSRSPVAQRKDRGVFCPLGANRAGSHASHHQEISYERPLHNPCSILGRALGMAVAREAGVGGAEAACHQLLPPGGTGSNLQNARNAVRRSEKQSSTRLVSSSIVPCRAERDRSSGSPRERQGLPRRQIRPATGQEAHVEGR